uniref:Gnk2-homologous domain-containing protein n=1 Tax=Oryza punctata TaxID=4537 RepID=A0A0E0KCW4_ORYPU
MALSRRARRCLVLLLVSLALLPLGMATDPIGGYCSESGTSDAEINGKARRRSINSVVSDLVAKAASNGGFATYDYCFMRYKNANFIGQVDMRVDASKAVVKTMGKAIAQAVATAGSAVLGRMKEKYTTFVNIYGLSPCTQDLTQLTCAQCLSTAVSNFGDTCNTAEGCQIKYSSCWVRYEIYLFYFPLETSG